MLTTSQHAYTCPCLHVPVPDKACPYILARAHVSLALAHPHAPICPHVQAQMEVLNKDEDVRLSLPMYVDLAKRLDQQLVRCPGSVRIVLPMHSALVHGAQTWTGACRHSQAPGPAAGALLWKR